MLYCPDENKVRTLLAYLKEVLDDDQVWENLYDDDNAKIVSDLIWDCQEYLESLIVKESFPIMGWAPAGIGKTDLVIGLTNHYTPWYKKIWNRIRGRGSRGGFIDVKMPKLSSKDLRGLPKIKRP